MLAALAAALALGAHPPTLLLAPCWAQSVPAGCGTLRVPEDRARPRGRTIGLHVVVVPARRQPSPSHAFAYLTGGPGGAATSATHDVLNEFAAVHEDEDIVLVDQRGTGRSHPLVCPRARDARGLRECASTARGDMRRYGTRAAADDLDAVRDALGYDRLDVYGVSYGATLAQVYLRRHRGHVRTLVLDGATFLDVSFFSRYARNAERALDRVAARCAARPACRRAFPRWRRQFHRLAAARPEVAGIVHDMLLDPEAAARIPLVVSRAAAGDLRPLRQEGTPQPFSRSLLFWSVWCNEPWVGLSASGPWGTDFDRWTESELASFRATCRVLPRRSEPWRVWHLPRTQAPVLVLSGGADPQDPAWNTAGLRWFFPNGRALVVRDGGHGVAGYGCVGGLVSIFVDRGGAGGLPTACLHAIGAPPFALG